MTHSHSPTHSETHLAFCKDYQIKLTTVLALKVLSPTKIKIFQKRINDERSLPTGSLTLFEWDDFGVSRLSLSPSLGFHK